MPILLLNYQQPVHIKEDARLFLIPQITEQLALHLLANPFELLISSITETAQKDYN